MNYLTKNHNKDLKSDVIKIGHHGDIKSSPKDFLEIVDPDYAVISVGANHYGHQDEQTLKYLDELNVKHYNTSVTGTVTIETNGKLINVHTKWNPIQ